MFEIVGALCFFIDLLGIGVAVFPGMFSSRSCMMYFL